MDETVAEEDAPRSETVIEEPTGAAKTPGCFKCMVPGMGKPKEVPE